MTLRSYVCPKCGGKVSEQPRVPLEKVRKTHDVTCPGRFR